MNTSRDIAFFIACAIGAIIGGVVGVAQCSLQHQLRQQCLDGNHGACEIYQANQATSNHNFHHDD